MKRFGEVKTEENVTVSGDTNVGTVGDLVAGALGKEVPKAEAKDEGVKVTSAPKYEKVETKEVSEETAKKVVETTKTEKVRTPWGTPKSTGNNNNSNVASAEANANFKGGIKTMEKQADIVSLVTNVRLADISEFLHEELNIDFNTTLKSFDPARVMDSVAENEREAMDDIIQKIVAFGEDGTYLTTVPAITVASSLLKSQIDDVNLVGIGINQEKPSLERFHSKYCVPHVVDRAGGESDVFLDTATVIALTAIRILGGAHPRKGAANGL